MSHGNTPSAKLDERKPGRLSQSQAIVLPQPTPQGVQKFTRLYREKFGVELEPKEALELATRTIQFVYLGITRCPTAPHDSDAVTDYPCPTTTSSQSPESENPK